MAVEAGTDPQTGSIKIVELWGHTKPGIADASTIAITTRANPLWLCAIVLRHEFVHAMRAQTGSPGNPEAGDPTTADNNPCGKCNHVMIGVDDLNLISELACDPPPKIPLADACEAWEEGRKASAKLLRECAYAGCTQCCGKGYIPNIGELVSKPPCCP